MPQEYEMPIGEGENNPEVPQEPVNPAEPLNPVEQPVEPIVNPVPSIIEPIIVPPHEPIVGTDKFVIIMDLCKWLIGTVGLTAISWAISWGFKDREEGMKEIKQYDQYVTDLVVLNTNPVAKRNLAQFFSCVPPSKKLKDGWKEYYCLVEKEYQLFLYKDSLLEVEIEKEKLDSSNLSKDKLDKLQWLEEQKMNNEIMKLAPIQIPNVPQNIQATLYIQTLSKTALVIAKNVQQKMTEVGFNVPKIEPLVKDFADNEIRYFNAVDKESTNILKTNLDNMNIKCIIKYMPRLNAQAKQGMIELWLK